jgi:hypothetical protein
MVKLNHACLDADPESSTKAHRCWQWLPRLAAKFTRRSRSREAEHPYRARPRTKQIAEQIKTNHELQRWQTKPSWAATQMWRCTLNSYNLYIAHTSFSWDSVFKSWAYEPQRLIPSHGSDSSLHSSLAIVKHRLSHGHLTWAHILILGLMHHNR